MFEVLFRPWRSRLWKRACFVALDIIYSPIAFTLVITLLSVTVGLLITFPLAIPFAWLLFVTAAGLGRIERSRVRALLDVDIANPHPPLPQVPQLPAETVQQACLLLDAQFPWLAAAFARRQRRPAGPKDGLRPAHRGSR